MLNRVSIRTLVVLLIILAGAWLTPGGLPSRTQAAKDLDLLSQQACDPEEDMDKDLDRIRPNCLKQYLWAELDDCVNGHDPNELIDRMGFQEEILAALRDDGDGTDDDDGDGNEDDDDEDETVISWMELIGEMSEAGTTCERVVRNALQKVDRAFVPRANTWGLVGVSFLAERSEFRSPREPGARQVRDDIILQIRRFPRR